MYDGSLNIVKNYLEYVFPFILITIFFASDSEMNYKAITIISGGLVTLIVGSLFYMFVKHTPVPNKAVLILSISLWLLFISYKKRFLHSCKKSLKIS